jgi:MerR family transcriptional regulator, thiopeptide resistance regulator
MRVVARLGSGIMRKCTMAGLDSPLRSDWIMASEAAKANLYRVGKFARLAGVTIKALHHYERVGLLTPCRTESGYRLYRERDLECVEQIVALRFLGLPLRQIRRILEQGALELPDALQLQRRALERRQRLLERAIAAIGEAEQAAQSGGTLGTQAMRRIIEAIHMQNNFELLEQLYSEESLARWKEFFHQAEAAALAGEDPAGETGFLLMGQWVKLTESILAVRDAGYRAYCDRANWPPELHRKMADFTSALRPYQMDDHLSRFLEQTCHWHRSKFYDDATWKSFFGGPLS